VKAYAIFEGGGAKGYAHIGALKAAEERGIEIAAVAGTSIGAVIACLIGAGYKADELYSLDAAGNARGILSLDPLDRLNKQDWARFEKLTKEYSQYNARMSGLSWRMYVNLLLIWVRLPLTVVRHWPLFRTLVSKLGLTATTGFREFLDDALRKKIGIPTDRTICFSDLRIPVKVIASDLVSEDIVVFPRRSDDSVVDAVVASASFPIFFEPAVFDNYLLVDGGVLSNRPAWVFDEERRISSEAMLTICFVLIEQSPLFAEKKPHRRPGSLVEFVSKLIRTSVFGRTYLETRGIQDLYSVEVAANIGVLSLQDAFDRAGDLVQNGRMDANRFFSTLIGPQKAEIMKKALEHMSASIYQLLSQYIAGPGDVRCSVLIKRDTNLARLSYASYQPAADYGVSVSLDSPGMAQCFKIRQPILTVVKKIPVEVRENALFKYEHAFRASDVEIIYSVPIFENGYEWTEIDTSRRSRPIAVLSISATSDLRDILRLSEIEDALASLAQVLSFGLAPKPNDDGWLSNTARETGSAQNVAEWRPLNGSEAFFISSRPDLNSKLTLGLARH
jgi:NTE family protein